ncbi:restriction endonuclease subunit S [Clostridium pasteurianum]|uniref:Restriction endonuclease S subunit n=1 Tax=Clostridium pasteurianum BC1 TaxID=86416 RepID=R4K4P4_CLOPA|nr:restriction endonuclease subunit S [Clostridium pasteurianum]AGK96696.1 restriction endonuclease S subunit [Clostridium pasteurianum BC1]
MNKYKLMNLGSICEFINGDRGKNYPSGNDFINSGIPFINAGHIKDNKINFENMNYISEEKFQTLGSGKVKKNDILFCLRGSLGKLAIADINNGAIASSLVIIRPKKNVINSQYLMHYLKSKEIYEQILKANNGSSQPNLSANSVKEFKLYIPDYEIQIKISKVLNKAQELIGKRKTQIEALDELVKSRFIEMFGDPVKNTMDWNMKPLAEVGSIGRGVSKHRPRNAPELLGGDYPLIQTGDVANAGLYIKDYKATYSELGLKQSKMWGKGTLCITIAANIAKTGILTFDACFPDSVVGFIAGDKTNNIFMYYWFSSFQKLLEEQAPESAQKNINLKILSDLKVIVPPIELQNQFFDFVNQVDKLEFEMQKSLTQLEDNFNSLMQKAFKGELFN